MSAHVQTVSANSATGSCSVTLTLTPGNAVLVTFVADVTSGSLGSITQTSGDTLVLWFSNNSSQYTAQYANFNVAGGSTTFTFTYTTTEVRMFVTEVSGLATALVGDQTAGTNATSSATISTGTTPTLSQANEFCLAAINADGSGSTTLVGFSNGFTVPTNGNQLSTFPRSMIAYKVVTSTAGVETTATTNDPTLSNGLIGTYKDTAGGGGGGATPFFTQLGYQRFRP